MRIIKRIIIENFRSIQKIDLDCENVNVFSGLNDTGKSNILKALNLYFNDETDFQCPLKFASDYSKIALASAQRSGKKKQQIKIKVFFSIPPSFSSLKSEKEVFLEKVFDREGKAEFKSSHDHSKKKAQITRLYNKIKYFYIPALKGPEVLQYLLGRIGEHQLISEENFGKLNEDLNQEIEGLASILGQSKINIQTTMGFPALVRDFWEKLVVNTEYDKFNDLQEKTKATKKGRSDPLKKEFYQIPLDLRGEGIKSKYIPPLLQWMQSRSQGNIYVWGIDEPENSLEFRKAEEIAELYFTQYCSDTQIFLTTHSFAFIFPREDIKKPTVFRCYKSDFVQTDFGQTKAEKIESLFTKQEKIELCEEIGALEVQKDFYASWREKDAFIKKQNAVIEQYKDDARPIVYVEGPFDEKILEIAWGKCKKVHMPFIIHACEGAPSIATLLKSKGLSAHSRIVIGLWDCDQSGYSYLKGLFEAKENKKKKFTKLSNTMVQCGKKVFGMVLPTPSNRNNYTNMTSMNPQLQFLSIEHYFDDNILKTSGLVEDEIEGRIFLKKSSKSKFAKKVVATLKPKDFKNFKILFKEIEQLIT